MENHALTLRMPKELWIFCKKKAIDRELSLNQLVIDCVLKYKKKCEKKVDEDK